MNKCIAFVDDDERFLEQSREHLTYRGYDVLGYRDSRTAFDAILLLKTRVGELVSLVAIFNRLFGSQDERVAELVALIHAFGHDANRYANHVSGAAYLCLFCARSGGGVKAFSLSGWDGLCPVGIAPPLSREKQRQRKKTSARLPSAVT